MIYLEHGGRKSMGQNAATALYYWLLARCPAATVKVQPDQLLSIQPAPKGLPQPGRQVVTLAVAAAEREFGKTPVYDDTKDDNGQSQDILDWLHRNGDVTKLEQR